jgi:hypothetical protein
VTTPEREFDSRLLLGLLGVLVDAGLGVWNDRGIYPAAAVGIFMLAVPDQPDRLITLSPYSVTDDADEAMSTEGVQVRTRWAGGNPLDVLDLDARVFGVLHGMSNVTLNTGVRISQCLRRSSASLGQDSSKRWGMSSNYYLDVERPAPNRF